MFKSFLFSMKEELKESLPSVNFHITQEIQMFGHFFNLRNKVFPQKTTIQCQQLIRNKCST